jgi:hypothetical protein
MRNRRRNSFFMDKEYHRRSFAVAQSKTRGTPRLYFSADSALASVLRRGLRGRRAALKTIDGAP